MGGAFADLLNEKGKGSGANEMGYVGRTLGFRTRDLEDRDLRLVISLFLLSNLCTLCLFIRISLVKDFTSVFGTGIAVSVCKPNIA